MSYQLYGIDPALIERVKFKIRNPVIKERLIMLLQSVTRADLQNRMKVAQLIGIASGILGENLTNFQANQILEFILAQNIDPSNTFHLFKLWSMFR